jgi:hypothetical protein
VGRLPPRLFTYAGRTIWLLSIQLGSIKRIIDHTPTLETSLRQKARTLELKLFDVRERFTGDPTRSARNEPAPAGLIGRIENIISGHWTTTSAPTASHRKNYDIAATEFDLALGLLHPLLETDLPALHQVLEAAATPWAPGRKLPTWKK